MRLVASCSLSWNMAQFSHLPFFFALYKICFTSTIWQLRPGSTCLVHLNLSLLRTRFKEWHRQEKNKTLKFRKAFAGIQGVGPSGFDKLYTSVSSLQNPECGESHKNTTQEQEGCVDRLKKDLSHYSAQGMSLRKVAIPYRGTSSATILCRNCPIAWEGVSVVPEWDKNRFDAGVWIFWPSLMHSVCGRGQACTAWEWWCVCSGLGQSESKHKWCVGLVWGEGQNCQNLIGFCDKCPSFRSLLSFQSFVVSSNGFWSTCPVQQNLPCTPDLKMTGLTRHPRSIRIWCVWLNQNRCEWDFGIDKFRPGVEKQTLIPVHSVQMLFSFAVIPNLLYTADGICEGADFKLDCPKGFYIQVRNSVQVRYCSWAEWCDLKDNAQPIASDQEKHLSHSR